MFIRSSECAAGGDAGLSTHTWAVGSTYAGGWQLGRAPNSVSSVLSRQQHGRSETEEYSSESESESEDEEELQLILEDLQRQNEELEVGVAAVQGGLRHKTFLPQLKAVSPTGVAFA